MFPGVFASTVREEGMADLREDVRIHALLVDDDGRLQTNARDFLEPYGCKISSLHDGRGIEAALEELKPDIVLLDVMLPGDDGFIVLQRLRAVSSIPVIMLTARGNDADRIVGLEMGADDYLPKPFNPRELLARIKAVLRRTTGQGAFSQEQHPDMLTAGSIRLDLKRQRLLRGEESIQLTTTEFRIIRVFMGHPDEILSRDDLQTMAFGENYYCNDRNIDVYVSRARNTLRKLCGESPIHTVWGSGYRWVSDGGGSPFRKIGSVRGSHVSVAATLAKSLCLCHSSHTRVPSGQFCDVPAYGAERHARTFSGGTRNQCGFGH